MNFWMKEALELSMNTYSSISVLEGLEVVCRIVARSPRSLD